MAGGGASEREQRDERNKCPPESRRFGAEILVRESQSLRELHATGPRNRTQRLSFYRATLCYAIIITIIIIITATMFIVLSS